MESSRDKFITFSYGWPGWFRAARITALLLELRLACCFHDVPGAYHFVAVSVVVIEFVRTGTVVILLSEDNGLFGQAASIHMGIGKSLVELLRGARGLAEIGRASCGERVCQEV